MRERTYFKVTKEVKDDNNIMDAVIKSHIGIYIGSEYDRGMIFRPWMLDKMRVGMDEDDFIMEKFTVIIERKVIKKTPRILSIIYKIKSYACLRRRYIIPIWKNANVSHGRRYIRRVKRNGR